MIICLIETKARRLKKLKTNIYLSLPECREIGEIELVKGDKNEVKGNDIKITVKRRSKEDNEE